MGALPNCSLHAGIWCGLSLHRSAHTCAAALLCPEDMVALWSFTASASYTLSLPQWSLNRKEGWYSIYSPFRAEHSVVSSSLHLGHSAVVVLIIIYWKGSFSGTGWGGIYLRLMQYFLHMQSLLGVCFTVASRSVGTWALCLIEAKSKCLGVRQQPRWKSLGMDSLQILPLVSLVTF